MAKWICKVCGYTHHGDEAPERCPQCGATKAQFYKEGENGTPPAKRGGCSLSVLLFLTLFTTLCFSIMSCSSATTVDNSTVKSLDLGRFMGRWYEIARFDHRFERDMQQVTTLYTLQENGKVTVTNQGLKDGKWKTSEGKGKLTNTPGLLRVSFWGPFYSDYRIMMLAPDYSYALIGGEDDTYLWILSRSPQLPQDTRNILLREAQRRGYNTNNLIWVQQKTTPQSSTW